MSKEVSIAIVLPNENTINDELDQMGRVRYTKPSGSLLALTMTVNMPNVLCRRLAIY
jgi:hypothetical protein